MLFRNKFAALLAGAVVFCVGSVRAQDTKGSRVSIEQVRGAAQALSAEVAHLIEDMEIDLRQIPNGQHLLDDAQEAAESAEHLAESVDRGVDLPHAAKDIQEFDMTWHHVAAQLRSVRVSRSLQRGIMRVAQADASLHRMLGVPAPFDIQEARRLADSLAQSAQHLLEDAEQSLGQSARNGQLLQIADDFADASEHFRASLAQGVNIEHARKDFVAVDDAWQALSERIFALSPQRFEHLQEVASRVAPVVGQLADTLGVVPAPQSSLPTTTFRSGPARSRTIAPDLDDSEYLPPSCDSLTGRCFVPRGFPPSELLYDDTFRDRDFNEEFVLPPSDRRSLGELRSLEREAPNTPGRRFELSPPRSTRPLPRQSEPQPRRGNSDEEMHEHSDGHTHSHGPAPAPTPAKPTTPGTGPTNLPAPRPVEPELDDEARANLAKLSPADRDAAIAQRTCPVTGDTLGEMGVPIKVRVQGRDVFVCCKGCVAKVQKDPEKYLPKIQN